jgi:hypothetical protein
MRQWRAALLLSVIVWLVPGLVLAQRGGFFRFGGPRISANPPYDGRFTFSRVRYQGTPYGRGPNAWADGYPNSERNFALILDALTAIPIDPQESNVFDLEDPEIFRHPILFLWEPGFWTISDEGAANLRAYMLKGGLIVFDDFEESHWVNFERQFRRALPEAQFIPLALSHPIYHSFFEIDELALPHPGQNVRPAYYAVFEDNDPTGRVMAIANHNADLSEYWEYSAHGWFPVSTSNEAYKVGVNYIVQGLVR